MEQIYVGTKVEQARRIDVRSDKQIKEKVTVRQQGRITQPASMTVRSSTIL